MASQSMKDFDREAFTLDNNSEVGYYSFFDWRAERN